MRILLSVFILTLASMAQAQVADKPQDVSPLLIGETIPATTVRSLDNKEVTLPSLLTGKKTVLIVYRGGWCPYCSAHLAEVGQIEKDLLALGYQIIAVSPDTPENLRKSIDKNKITYTLISDKGAAFIKSAGLAFKAPAPYETLLKENGNPELVLPVPALFLVNEANEIVFEYINPDFKKRISGDLLLAAAKINAKK